MRAAHFINNLKDITVTVKVTSCQCGCSGQSCDWCCELAKGFDYLNRMKIIIITNTGKPGFVLNGQLKRNH